MTMDDGDIMAALDELRARCAALEFAVGIDRADERRRAVEWALAYEQAAPYGAVRPEVAEYVEARLRGIVEGASMFGPRDVAALAAEPLTDRAKLALFSARADPAEARACVAWLRGRRAAWADYGLSIAEAGP